MHCERELGFMCEVLKKERVAITLRDYPFDKAAEAIGTAELLPHPELDTELEPSTELLPHPELDTELEPTTELLPHPELDTELEPSTEYKLTDEYGRCYVYMLLPDGGGCRLLRIGPYIAERPSAQGILELGERLGVAPAHMRHFEEYFMSLPVLEEGNAVFALISTFCERLFNTTSFSIVDMNKKNRTAVSPISEGMSSDSPEDILIRMTAMERRYAFENEMIRAVSLGQLHKEDQLLTAFSGNFFEQRLPDRVRNVKNYSVIMNTLLRKAAETGGVHPVYIDRVSSELAARIEQMSDFNECYPLMRDMFRTYCRLVRKHSLKNYSIAVKRAVLIIDSDLSGDLSLSALAEALKVSAGYLSSIFKRDTGKTLTEYVRDRRMTEAMHLLATTSLQIQTVALHIGIVDVQYFSKQFKAHTGVTPREWRERAKADGTAG